MLLLYRTVLSSASMPGRCRGGTRSSMRRWAYQVQTRLLSRCCQPRQDGHRTSWPMYDRYSSPFKSVPGSVCCARLLCPTFTSRIAAQSPKKLPTTSAVRSEPATGGANDQSPHTACRPPVWPAAGGVSPGGSSRRRACNARAADGGRRGQGRLVAGTGASSSAVHRNAPCRTMRPEMYAADVCTARASPTVISADIHSFLPECHDTWHRHSTAGA
jgi:hypothetical protein